MTDDHATYYDALRVVHEVGPRFELSTGQPLHDPELGQAMASALSAIAGRHGIGARLATYSDLDGSPELRAAFAAMLGAQFGRRVSDAELLVVPGAQAALRYVHGVVRDAGRRLLFPVGLEYPGSFDTEAAAAPSVGQPKWSSDGSVIDLQPDTLDWQDVGAVILSHPHSPTGRVWPSSQLQRLADEATSRSAWLVLDETFALPARPLQLQPVDVLDQPGVVHLYSFSKIGLAAERVGVISADPAIITALRRELRKGAITASYLGQLLATALLKVIARTGAGRALADAYRTHWQTLRDALRPAIAEDPSVAIAAWQGGPFLWLTWRGGPDDAAVFRALLRHGVGTAPGTVLHAAGTPVRGVRVGLGASPESLTEVGARISAALRDARTRSAALTAGPER
jgi:alanine-alpha-ketoisovalerate/valine-pyruvate aminotransferase